MEVEVGSLYCPFRTQPLNPQELPMKAINKKQFRKPRGQGMTEYIIIVALIAIAAIGVITLFGDNIRKLFGASAAALAGESSVNNDGQLSNNTLNKKTMKNFGQNNAY
jgi:Flp pilus assembly pilin Flp